MHILSKIDTGKSTSSQQASQNIIAYLPSDHGIIMFIHGHSLALQYTFTSLSSRRYIISIKPDYLILLEKRQDFQALVPVQISPKEAVVYHIMGVS